MKKQLFNLCMAFECCSHYPLLYQWLDHWMSTERGKYFGLCTSCMVGTTLVKTARCHTQLPRLLKTKMYAFFFFFFFGTVKKTKVGFIRHSTKYGRLNSNLSKDSDCDKTKRLEWYNLSISEIKCFDFILVYYHMSTFI